MKKIATMWEYKCGINAIIANFVCMWKSQIVTCRLVKCKSDNVLDFL